MRYTFSIANDTINGKVAPVKLTSEIRASAIVYALEGVTLSGDNLYIDFKSALSSAEENTLTVVVAAHDGVASIDDLTKFVFTDLNGNPVAANLIGPEGPKGDKGDVGAQGPAGGISEFNYAENEEESSTTSGTYQAKLSSDFTLLGGDYLVEWYCEASSSDKDMKVQVMANNSVLAELDRGQTDRKNIYEPVSGFKRLSLPAGTYTFSINYNDAGAGTAKLRRARIKVYGV